MLSAKMRRKNREAQKRSVEYVLRAKMNRFQLYNDDLRDIEHISSLFYADMVDFVNLKGKAKLYTLPWYVPMGGGTIDVRSARIMARFMHADDVRFVCDRMSIW